MYISSLLLHTLFSFLSIHLSILQSLKDKRVSQRVFLGHIMAIFCVKVSNKIIQNILFSLSSSELIRFKVQGVSKICVFSREFLCFLPPHPRSCFGPQNVIS